MAKHTPGPWQLSENGLAVYGPGEDPWGITYLTLYEQRAIAQGEGIPDEGQRANARLIASAPDLLAACEEWAEIWQPGKKHEAAWRRLMAAIAKAKGTA